MTEAEARRGFRHWRSSLRLRRAGFQALWAGGCVRDLLLGQTPADYDVATERDARAGHDEPCPSGRSRSGSRSAWCGSAIRGTAASRSRWPRSAATWPTSTAAGPSRSSSARPSSTRPAATSRSTACSWTRSRAQVIDYVGGRDDLHRQVLRAIGDPAERFREDKLRLLRAVRFAARFGLRDRADHAGRPLGRWPARSSSVSPERIAQELRRMLVHEIAGRGDGPGPRARAARGDPAPGGRDEGALPGQADAARGRPVGPYPARPPAPAPEAELHAGLRRPAARRGQALHPLAPPRHGRASTTTSRSAAGSPTGSAGTSSSPTPSASGSPGWSPFISTWARPRSCARRSSSASSPSRGSRSSWPCTGPTRWPRRAIRSTSTTARYYLENQPAGPINPPPLLTGHDLVRHGLEPGPAFKTILDQVREAQLERRIHSKREALEWVDQHLATGVWPGDEGDARQLALERPPEDTLDEAISDSSLGLGNLDRAGLMGR